ncbi:hypothetical protein BDW66DRAFT_4712 [Aspergillus desertorum]
MQRTATRSKETTTDHQALAACPGTQSCSCPINVEEMLHHCQIRRFRQLRFPSSSK